MSIITLIKNSPGLRLISYLPLVLFTFLQLNGRGAEKDGGFIAYPGARDGPGPTIFSHMSHGQAGFRCDKCHNSGLQKLLPVSMENIRRGQSCGSCHDGRTQGPVNRKTAASVNDCSVCHMPATDIVIQLNRMDPVHFSHIRHLSVDPREKTMRSQSLSCVDCHPVPFDRAQDGPVGMEVPHENGGCAVCHNEKKGSSSLQAAFAATSHCLTCHKQAEKAL
jgi:c(7)-type cytochrome triheme protein